MRLSRGFIANRKQGKREKKNIKNNKKIRAWPGLMMREPQAHSHSHSRAEPNSVDKFILTRMLCVFYRF